ncbi:hypothetical protein, partial [Bacillus cereus]|uniref:hypothetical protein n=1 Tax=Bacillus cereus TaxID=1396 RepID=UPI001E4B8081
QQCRPCIWARLRAASSAWVRPSGQHYFAVNTIGPLLLAEALRPALAKAKGVIIQQVVDGQLQPGHCLWHHQGRAQHL